VKLHFSISIADLFLTVISPSSLTVLFVKLQCDRKSSDLSSSLIGVGESIIDAFLLFKNSVFII